MAIDPKWSKKEKWYEKLFWRKKHAEAAVTEKDASSYEAGTVFKRADPVVRELVVRLKIGVRGQDVTWKVCENMSVQQLLFQLCQAGYLDPRLDDYRIEGVQRNSMTMGDVLSQRKEPLEVISWDEIRLKGVRKGYCAWEYMGADYRVHILTPFEGVETVITCKGSCRGDELEKKAIEALGPIAYDFSPDHGWPQDSDWSRKYLCQLGEGPELILRMKKGRVSVERNFPPATMYGCPAASIPGRGEELTRCSVEVVDYA